jgi:hypothetical protein
VRVLRQPARAQQTGHERLRLFSESSLDARAELHRGLRVRPRPRLPQRRQLARRIIDRQHAQRSAGAGAETHSVALFGDNQHEPRHQPLRLRRGGREHPWQVRGQKLDEREVVRLEVHGPIGRFLANDLSGHESQDRARPADLDRGDDLGGAYSHCGLDSSERRSRHSVFVGWAGERARQAASHPRQEGQYGGVTHLSSSRA